MHTSLVWHKDVASHLDGYEGRSSYALICIFLWLNVGCDGDMLLQMYIVPLGWHALRCGLWELDIPYECLLHSVALLHGYLDIGWYGCNEINLIVMLLHGDGHFAWNTGLWRLCMCCFFAFLCNLIGLQYNFLLIYG